MITIQGFTPFTPIERIGFARAGNWKQSGLDRQGQFASRYLLENGLPENPNKGRPKKLAP